MTQHAHDHDHSQSHAHEHEHHAGPRRYAGTTIDTHAHWYPQEWMDLV